MLTKKQKAYLNIARYLATRSELRHKHGAVVVKSGRVVGMGWNKRRNHPRVIPEGKHKEQCDHHAEAVAIREAGTNANGSIVFVARVNRNGEDLLSKPCLQCQKLIERSGVKYVLWTSSNS